MRRAGPVDPHSREIAAHASSARSVRSRTCRWTRPIADSTSGAAEGSGVAEPRLGRVQRQVHQEPECLGGGDDAQHVRGAGDELPGELVVLHVAEGDLALGDHVAAVEERQGPLEEGLPGVEDPDAEGGEDLVEGEGEVVDVQLGHVDGAGRRELRGVDQDQRAARSARAAGSRCGRRSVGPGRGVAWCPGSSRRRSRRRAWCGGRRARRGGRGPAGRCGGRTGRPGTPPGGPGGAGPRGSGRARARSWSCAPSGW